MDLVIFDLDGTLIDSRRDLTDATNAARLHMDLPPLSEAVVATYIGNGAPVLIRRAMGPEATAAQIDAALAFFLQYYLEHKLDKTVLYPGVREALDELRAAGVPMAVLTNKPMAMTTGIVQGLGLNGHFFRLCGGDSFPVRKPDPVGINALRAEVEARPERTLMVGDSHIDIETARNAHVKSCGVSFGLQPESLVTVPPDLMVDDMRDMARYVLTERHRTYS